MTPSFTPEKDSDDGKMAPRSGLSHHGTDTPSGRRMPPAFLQTPSLMTPSYKENAPLTAATQPMTPMTDSTTTPDEPLMTVSSRVSAQPGTAPTTAPFPRDVDCDDDGVPVHYRPTWQYGGSRLFAEDAASPRTRRAPPQDRPTREVSSPPPFPGQRELSHRAVSGSAIPEPHCHLRSFSNSSIEYGPAIRTSSMGSRLDSDSQVEEIWSMTDNLARRRSSSASIHRQRSLRTHSSSFQNKIKRDTTPETSSSSESSPDVSPSPTRTESKRLRRSRSLRPKSPTTPDPEGKLLHWLGRIRTNRLVLILCGVGMTSLLATVFTSRAVIPNDMGRHEDAFRPVVKPGIRRPGSMTQVGHHKVDAGRAAKEKSDKNEAHKDARDGNHDDKPHKDDHKHEDKHDDKPHKDDKHDDKHHTHDDKHHKDDPKHHESDHKHNEHGDTHKNEHHHEKKVEKPDKWVPLQKQKLRTAVEKPLPLKDFEFVAYGLDASMYKKSTPSKVSPRLLKLHESASQKTERGVEDGASPVFDNTQLYGVLDSNDEALSLMEMREPHTQGECVPMQDWQTTFHPSCNGMHELAPEHMGEVDGNVWDLFGKKGYWRNAWKLDLQAEHDSLVLKTLKFQHNFEDAHFEHDRIDAVAMERLTSSPHVINVFGYCGHSVLTEYADGKRLGELADKAKKTPLARLKIARDIAEGLADVHGIDGDGNATFVHLDVNPANVVSIGGRLKLNDFNIGILLRWNTTSNQHCGFPAQYPNPQWRSPEEARGEQNLSEKVDVFSMGHIFFRLVCGHEPWNKFEPDGRPSKDEVNEKVQKGVLPFVPKFVLESKDPEEIAIRDVMIQCYTYHPEERPSSREVANMLDEALQRLSSESAS